MKAASTVVLVRDGNSGPELLFVKRPESMRFLGGFHAFPGGALDPDDFGPRARELSSLSAESAAEAMGDDAGEYPALGFYVCALRELFEEVGILLTDDTTNGDLRSARAELLNGGTPFSEIVERLGVTLGTHLLRYHTRWTAPEALPIRFDVRVFIAAARGEPDPDPREVAAIDWMSPTNALARSEIGTMLMAPPTVATISSVAGFGSAKEMVSGHRAETHQREPEVLSQAVRRLVAPNASVMTGPGSNTYLVGRDRTIVIDPASMDRQHLHAIADAGKVFAIVVTHHHPDHASGSLDLAEMTGAKVMGSRKLIERFLMDESWVPLDDGSVIEADDVSLEIIETPGHASDHICLWLASERALFSGDLILGEGTTVISPPDGNLSDYLQSLERVAALYPDRIYPGHFGHRDDASSWIDWYLNHRREREQQILAVLEGGAVSVPEIVEVVYRDYPANLHPVAERSVLAHLEKLIDENRVIEAGSKFRLID